MPVPLAVVPPTIALPGELIKCISQLQESTKKTAPSFPTLSATLNDRKQNWFAKAKTGELAIKGSREG